MMRTVLSVLVLTTGLQTMASPASDQVLAQGRAAESVNNFKKAAQIYRKALAFPDSYEQGTISLSRTLMVLGEFDEAHTVLTDYLKNGNPFNVDAHLLMAEVYMNKNQLAEASAEMKVVESLRPGLPKTAETNGAIHFKQGKFDKAIELLSGVLKSDASNWNAHYFRGRSYYSLQQWENANADFKVNVEQRPNNLEVQNFYAETFMKQGKWAEAEKVLHYCVKINPNEVPALTKLSEVYAATNRKDEMITTYKRLLEIEPLNSDVADKLADAFIQLKQYKTAEEELRRQLRVMPGYEPAGKKMVRIWNEQKRYDLVGTFLREYTEQRPDSVWATSEYIRMLTQVNNPSLAMMAVEKFEKADKGGTPNAALMKGYIHYSVGKNDEAIRELADVQKKWPRDGRIAYNLGLAYAGKKDWQRAAKYYQAVTPDSPAYFKAHFNLAVVYEANGQFESALTELRSIPHDNEYGSMVRSKIAELENSGARMPSSRRNGE